MKTSRLFLCIVLTFCASQLFGQRKWSYDFGLGTSLHMGNVNTCNLNNYAAINRNDSLLAFDFHYKVLYSSIIDKNDAEQQWKETNFEVNGGIKLDYKQYGRFSPFLACEMLTNKYKGYDFKMSGLIGLKYRIYVIPSICDYSISAAFVSDWTDFTDVTVLPNRNYRISIRPKIKQKLTENLSLLNLTYYQPSILDFGDFIINSATQLQTKLSNKLFLDISFIYEYRSRVPADHYKKHDLQSSIALRLKF